MPFPHWQSLSPESQAIWDTLPDDDKALILGARDAPCARPSHGMNPTHVQNTHELMEPSLLETHLHGLVFSDPPVPATNPGLPDVTSPTAPDDTSTMLLVHATNHTWTKPKGSNLSPSDIRKVISSTTHHDSGSLLEPTDITIQGKVYCLVNAVHLYNVSAALHCSSLASLVFDHDANGSVAGGDVWVIYAALCSVDIKSADNNCH